ncbi:LacI family DNA-binding transcriptional regulator [Georgenia faecalis]|uniref:LacI family DNA-binding transcriptional regulator n=1 Tax=Georgenia faecalis TaxID=2483799 RepID=UPI000FD9702C|nr:LacI family DNA-binding transcriptional regulator [Georgenia faecalis]
MSDERRGAPRATIADVARRAEVSVGTVSNVLNRPDRVAPATLGRVRAVIEELDFVRNASARQLREGHVRAVGAVVLDIANPFFTEMSRGIEDRVARDDYTLMLCSSDEDPAREARYLRLFAEQGVDGILVAPSRSTMDNLERIRKRGTNVVLLDYMSPLPDLSSVAVDDVAGGRLAVDHLLAQGHRTIGFLNGPPSIRQCVDRRDGVIAGLVAAGLDPGEHLVEVGMDSLNANNGARAMAALLAAPGTRPSATFCVNDVTALGALRTLREEGVRVSDEMAVVGYDDVHFAAELTVPLTSVRQPMQQIGWTAADLLLGDHDDARQVVFQPDLVVRRSSVVGTA